MFPFVFGTGYEGALAVPQIKCRPITAYNCAVGDLVKFDLDAGYTTSGTYTDLTKYEDFNHPKCPFNVVKEALAGSATDEKVGIWGVVVKAATEGNRCDVVIFGIVDAMVSTVATTNPMTAGMTGLIPNSLRLRPAPVSPSNASGACLGIALETRATTAAQLSKIFFNGFAMAVGGA